MDTMVNRKVKFSLPARILDNRIIILDQRIVNGPAIILLGYIALVIVILLSNQTFLQIGLAIILAVFGSGISTIAVFFPRQSDLDFVERAALSACFSLTIGGILGFALAQSPWGLHLWTFLAVTGLYNVVCFILTWYRRRNFGEDECIIRLDIRELYFWRKTNLSISSYVITTVLVILFLAGAWSLTSDLRSPVLDPPMTEFYLLGQKGRTEEYPKTGYLGETFSIVCGITNRENKSASYQIKAYIGDQEVGNSQPANLETDETQISEIKFHLLDTLFGQTKVEFVLYRDEKPYRFLHLWIDVVDT